MHFLQNTVIITAAIVLMHEITMHNNQRLFLLNTPIDNIIKKITYHRAHFFAYTIDGTILMVNDEQALMLANMGGASNIIGENIYTFFSPTENTVIKTNNIKTATSTIPQLFYETGKHLECMCVKACLHDSSNQVIGVGGIAMYYHQMTFKDITTVANELMSLLLCSKQHTYDPKNSLNTALLKKLSFREQECAVYLAQRLRYKEIAKILNISSRTVEVHLANIKHKLGCYSITEVINKISATTI